MEKEKLSSDSSAGDQLSIKQKSIKLYEEKFPFELNSHL